MLDLKQAQMYYGFANHAREACFDGVTDQIVAQPQAATGQAPLVSIVGGSGGVGRSTIALLMATLAASQGIDTVLLEGDLQFGDMSFWLGIADDAPSLVSAQKSVPVRSDLGFDLYRAPLFPEAADELGDSLIGALDVMRRGRGLVIADTGSYWSGFVASLLLHSDLYLMLADQRPSSVAAAVKASELCARLGAPSTRMVPVYNRWNSKNKVSAKEYVRALGAVQVHCIADGREQIDEAFCSGDVKGLLEEQGSVVDDVRDLLESILPRVGYSCETSEGKRKGFFR